MIDTDSVGQLEMRALSRRPRSYGDDQADPTRRHDLRMASELVAHLERLTAKLARPTTTQLHSGRRP
jgi:hypothetical protein